jgi:hypothetical protein
MELKTNVSLVVGEIVSSFKTKSLEMSKGFFFSQYDTVNLINLYINDKFRNRADGIFWQISTSRIGHVAKNIDLDTKELMPYGEGDMGIFESYCLRIKIRRWLDENHFAITLNDMSEGVATYGSVVWKKYKENGKTKIEETDLRNLYFNPTVKYIKDADVVEMHYLTDTEIKEKKDVWDNVDKAIKIASKTTANGETNNQDVIKHNEIWEYTGNVEYEDGSFEYRHYIGAGSGEDEVILLEEDFNKDTDFQYFDFHIGRYRGRWLRMGIPERLFKLQQRANTLVNENAQATSIASLLLLRTSDSNTTGNVLTGALNGQIINSADLQQIGIDNGAFTMLLNELVGIERQADILCNTPEIVSGENAPAGTPFRSLAVTQNNAKSSFKYVKERIGETVGYILKEKILPSEIKKWNKGEILEIMEDSGDVEMYDKWLKDQMLLDQLKSGTSYSPELEAKIQEAIDRDAKYVGRKVDIKKGLFSSKFNIKFNITGESQDKAQQNDAYFNALQMVQANPAIVDVPLFRDYCSNNGIPYWKLTPKQKQNLMQTAQAMGPAKPNPMAGQPQDQLMGAVDTSN